jgi:HKD family nuclease
MATLSFLLQAITKSNHAISVRSLLSIPAPSKALISVAFARSAGVELLEDALKKLGKNATVYVGIRNEITSKQALKTLLAYKVKVYVVDTGCRHVIFHPKVYLAANGTTGQAIIGSANLTFNGLNNNIEVSTHVNLDFTQPDDWAFADTIYESFNTLVANHPDHVLQIKTNAEIDDLYTGGRLEDEDVIRAPQTGGGSAKIPDVLAPMKLIGKISSKPKLATTPKAKPAVKAVAAPLATKTAFQLVWESKPLSERDLNVPKAVGTHVTGIFGLKKALYDFDQRHYFHDNIFAGLHWIPPKPGSLKLITTAVFELIISNVNYGKFTLQLTHDTDTSSRSYKQGNIMTHLHWGAAKQFVAKEHLLGRIFYLYKNGAIPPEYIIEID